MAASNVLGSMGTGAAAGASFGPYGALAGAAVGLIGGVIGEYEAAQSERERRRIIEEAAQQYGTSVAEMQQMVNNFYSENTPVGREADLTKYRELVDNYDPNEFVYDYEDFDNNYNVDDYYAKNKDAIIDKVSDQLQHTAAGAGIGRGTGAANQIATGVAEKNEDLYKDAVNAMNQDRQFAYNLWNAKIQQGQNRLNQLQNAYNTQIGMYGNLAEDYQQWQQNKLQQSLDLQNNAATNKMQLTLASI